MKHPDQWALFGGTPSFAQPLHVGQLNLPQWDQIEVTFRGIFERQWYTNHGPLAREFDIAFARHLGVKHAITVNNGTVALMVAARALGFDQGEVIVPSFTFPATVQALSWAGLTPIFCDVSPETHTLTAEQVRPLITPSTVAIAGVHLWGQPCDPEALAALAEEFGLALLFDAAHAVGCTHHGRPLGQFGDMATFSFHATKIVNAAEGGCIATNDDELAARAKTIRSFHPGEQYAPVDTRINGKMSEAQAGLALLSLAELESNIAANRQRHMTYQQRLGELPGLRLLTPATHDTSNYQYVTVVIDGERAGLCRDQLARLLDAENIICRRYFEPGTHRLPPYRDDPALRVLSLPVTERLCRDVLVFPNGTPMTEDDVSKICDVVEALLAQAPALRAKLEQVA